MKGYIKFLDCLFVSIAIIDFYDSLVLYPAIIIPALSHYQPTLQFFNLLLTVASLLFVLIFPVLWHWQESNGKADSGLRHAWFTGIIRYWLAVEIFNYAFAKILGTQFDPSYFKGDSTWNSLSGSDITWNYFRCLGLSYLLLLQWRAVKVFFIQSRPSVPAIRSSGEI